jgi:O-acetyl-ADP-ribose deacetylase (regulator of RNase III)
MIKFVSGDILKATTGYIAHGVAEGNQEGLGTGLALKISTKCPGVQILFKKHARSGKFKGGNIWICEPNNYRPGFVYLATQKNMFHANAPYLRKSIKRLSKWAEVNKIALVHLPKVGAGLGKLSWFNDVKPIFEEYLKKHNTFFKVYEDYKLE